MSNKNIIRAWKDEEFRLSLTEAERALLPQNPAGLIELSGIELDQVKGGYFPPHTANACNVRSVGLPCYI
jgi:mersacidin/lichenicidin family type 2 lantibiotic